MNIRFTSVERIVVRISLTFLLVAQSLAMASHANAEPGQNSTAIAAIVICTDGELRETKVDHSSGTPLPFSAHCPDCVVTIAIGLPTKSEIQLPVLFHASVIFPASNPDCSTEIKRPDRVNCLDPPLST